jgi:urease accessory protein
MNLGAMDQLASRSRMLQLASQALPTGAYAYSGGMESALALGWLTSEPDATAFLKSWMMPALGQLELPCFLRMHQAFSRGDAAEAHHWSCRLFASRESAELQAQDRQMARAMERIMLQVCGEKLEQGPTLLTYMEGLALAGVHYGLSAEDASVVCSYSWIEQHVSALSRLLPLGPLAGQRVLDACLSGLPQVIEHACSVLDDDVGTSVVGLSLACAFHETQYTRIFRS